MIATRNNLPLLEDHDGEVRAIETRWLLAALERAAVKAGFFEWWLADHVISGVCSYFGGFYAKNVVGLGRLEEVVRQALRDIGYNEIAGCFAAEFPSTRISLLECARRLEPIGADGFYELVASQIDDLHCARLTEFHFSDLYPCLGFINDACDAVAPMSAEDVVGFVRTKISSLDWGGDLSCSVY